MKNRILWWTFIVSLLLHLLLLLLIAPWTKSSWVAKAEKKNAPLVFDLVPPAQQQTPRPRQFVDAPDNLPENAPDDPNTNLLSSKNMRARNNAPDDVPLGNTPYAQGSTDLPSIASPPPGEQQQTQQENPSDKPKEAVEKQEEAEIGLEKPQPPQQRQSNFNKNMLLSNPGSLDQPESRQTASKVKHEGGMTFNTYAWEWAPYARYLLGKLRSNNYPPPVYTRLGRGGKVVYQFRIYKDGRLEGPLFIENKGEKSLVETARRAIVLSAPFKALPDKFPEPYLEITITFEY